MERVRNATATPSQKKKFSDIAKPKTPRKIQRLLDSVSEKVTTHL
jgi:hypothetical protein